MILPSRYPPPFLNWKQEWCTERRQASRHAGREAGRQTGTTQQQWDFTAWDNIVFYYRLINKLRTEWVAVRVGI